MPINIIFNFRSDGEGGGVYVSARGRLIQRVLINNAYAWALFSNTGELVDHDAYRNDLAERHNIELDCG